MKVKKATLYNIAGYSSVTWNSLQPNVNLLLGRNGVGKSTVLQSLAFALTYLAGKRSEDLLLKTYPEASIEIQLEGLTDTIKLEFDDIRGKQGYRDFSYEFIVWQIAENRQPKNTVGVGRNSLKDHPTSRYPNAISELKALLSNYGAERNLAHEVFEVCKRIPVATNESEWDWIEKEIDERGPKHARPLSCGQFDIAAFALDLVRIKNQIKTGDHHVFVILDNPETFLHPACQNPVIDIIRELLPDAQLFIASHSLKLLCCHEPKSVFWLSRENSDENRNVEVNSIRGLPLGGKKVFFELYGDDVNSAVFNLIHSFESPEYYKFLYESALPPKEEVRKKPSVDRQMLAIVEELPPAVEEFILLDIGTGHGDLLTSILEADDPRTGITFIGASFNPSEILKQRISEAIQGGKITPDSTYVTNIDDVKAKCDVVVLCNVCHEIPIREMGATLGKIIKSHLKHNTTAKLIVHEVETLTSGESFYMMWDPSDYEAMFASLSGISVKSKSLRIHNTVPLNTTIITVNEGYEVPTEIENILQKEIYKLLPIKKTSILKEIIELNKSAMVKEGLEEAMRQRRLAFLMAEVTTICVFENDILP